MAILVTCRACEAKLRVRDEYLGKDVWCPSCKAPLKLIGERVPNHEVFISYSNKDKTVADAICATLEEKKIRCWIAPRDIDAGHSWGGSIIEAIEDAKVMLLVYSANSNLSPQVTREIERAVAKGLMIVPFRIESAPMSKEMEYFLSASHWFDALTPPLEKHITQLAEMVRLLLFKNAKAKEATPSTDHVAPAKPRALPWRWIGTTAALIGLMLVIGALLWARQHQQSPDKVVNPPIAVQVSSGLLPQPVVSVHDVMPLKVEADTVWERIGKREKGQVSDEELAELDKIRRSAETYFVQVKDYASAQATYRDFLGQTQRILQHTEKIAAPSQPLAKSTSKEPVHSVTFENPPPLVAPQNASGLANTLTLQLAPDTTMELKLIPAGTFAMGAPSPGKNKKKKISPDMPQHEVVLTKPFYMGSTEVTRQQFKAFVDQSGYMTEAEQRGWSTYYDVATIKKIPSRNWCKPGYEAGPDHPVACVTWNDAHRFCTWLAAITGRSIRLPTEAEWEYACRAGTTTTYQWGDDPAGGEGWCNVSDQSLRTRLPLHLPGINSKGACNWNDGYAFTAPVGHFCVNPWGLFDMHGNLWEWCADWYQPDYYETSNRVDPQGPDSGSQRVIRGGCFDEAPHEFRSASRYGVSPDCADFGIGFRVCCESAASVSAAAQFATPTSGVPAILAADSVGKEARQPQALTADAAKQPFTTFTNTVGAEMVYIPPGEFMMGSTPDERAWAKANGCGPMWSRFENVPLQKTLINHGFWMGKTEVTVGQWKQFVNATQYQTDAEKQGDAKVFILGTKKRDMVKGASWRNPNFGFMLSDNHPACCL